MTKPWQTLSSREVYRNPWIKVRQDIVMRPDWKKGIYGVVDMGPFPLIAALKYTWELPAGYVDKGEPILEVAKRELKEEVGLEAKKWTNLGIFYEANSAVINPAYLFLAEERRVDKEE